MGPLHAAADPDALVKKASLRNALMASAREARDLKKQGLAAAS
jgi:hypothetical protein